jgi:hypothetical protein
MKHLIFMTSILTSTLSFAMSSNSSNNQPRKSIMLFNNDNELVLMIKTGDAAISNTKHNAYKFLYSYQQMVLSPSDNVVPINILNKKVETLNTVNLHLGKNSTIQLGDTIRVEFDKDKSKIVITKNDTTTLETLLPTDVPINLGLVTAQMIPIKKRLYLRNNSK